MFLDRALARRIEAGEALNAAQSGEFLAVAGGYAAFAGVGSALTHAIGLGMDGPVTTDEFNRMEEFYRSRGAWVNLDFCPHADTSLMELLGTRGYRIVECSNALAGPVAGSPDARVRRAEPHEEELWCRVMLEGFFGRRDLRIDELEMATRLFRLDQGTAWFGIADGTPVAAGAMNVRSGLALLYADSTLEAARGRGLHLALIRARLAHAATLGCDLATASTLPGSISQRNYERAGFRVVYTKLNMQRDWP
jgi:GNAT superfamily N-acetyltransferase